MAGNGIIMAPAFFLDYLIKNMELAMIESVFNRGPVIFPAIDMFIHLQAFVLERIITYGTYGYVTSSFSDWLAFGIYLFSSISQMTGQ